LRIKFYIDPGGTEPHFKKHDVSTDEIFDFFRETKYIEIQRTDKSFEGYGKLASGRFIQVAYRRETNDTIFVITAYDIEDREILHCIEEIL
jgi:uncharacterized DUF497 family protein